MLDNIQNTMVDTAQQLVTLRLDDQDHHEQSLHIKWHNGVAQSTLPCTKADTTYGSC